MDELGEEVTPDEANFRYLLEMNFLNMSNERVAALKKEAEKKRQTVIELENTTPEDMWKADLYELKQVHHFTFFVYDFTLGLG